MLKHLCRNYTVAKGPPNKSRGCTWLYNDGTPLKRIALDVAGHFPVTDLCNKYILIIMDCFSRWSETFSFRNKKMLQ